MTFAVAVSGFLDYSERVMPLSLDCAANSLSLDDTDLAVMAALSLAIAAQFPMASWGFGNFPEISGTPTIQWKWLFGADYLCVFSTHTHRQLISQDSGLLQRKQAGAVRSCKGPLDRCQQ